MIFKIFFTWWNRQTLGTFFKTLFFGKLVGSDEFGNKYYKSKRVSVGLFIQIMLRLLKSLQTGIFGCIIQQTRFQIKEILNTLGKKIIKKIKLEQKIALNQ